MSTDLKYWKAVLNTGVAINENWLSNLFSWIGNKIRGNENEVEKIVDNLKDKSKEELRAIILGYAEKINMTEEELNKENSVFIKDNWDKNSISGLMEDDSISPNYIAYSFGRGVGYLLFLLASAIFIIGSYTILTASLTFVLKGVLCLVWAKLILD